jgi:hypothetical protein
MLVSIKVYSLCFQILFCSYTEKIFAFRLVGNPAALQRAKKTLDSEYSVVGLLEELEGSLLVMEALLPLFMMNATASYSKMSMYYFLINKLRISQKSSLRSHFARIKVKKFRNKTCFCNKTFIRNQVTSGAIKVASLKSLI